MSVRGYMKSVLSTPAKLHMDKRTALGSVASRFLVVLGVLPRSLPGVLRISTTALIRSQPGRYTFSRFDGTYLRALLKISAMCSFNHSISLITEYSNSSSSC